ncbi:alpha/beta hydrolase [Alkalibacterium sp. MB6]|uniref:alpha/beta hydrolase n=1 Tax=Alkalibacterium sp. MB6 TaxID=2081965 RepID=UPI00137A7346|nr:alpha/beta hydrolase [Alkalibacterium sp. MB6]
MNPLFKFILRIASSPKIDIQEDYVWIRRVQKILSKTTPAVFRYLDNKIYALDENQKQQHEIPVRMFYPKEKRYDESIIYIHGGGWVIGDIDTYTRACRNLADQMGRIVYSIDYRLAPEYPYPAGLNDCLRAVEVLLTPVEGDEEREWILMGDSAGANLAAAVSLRMKEENRRLPKKQVLLYPVTYWDHTEASPFESIRTNGHDYGLTIKKIQEYMELYVPDEEMRKERFISPLMAPDLTNQPDTLIITAEFDPLRDEGEAYGKALGEAGNEVVIHRVLNSVHGFITYPPFAEPLDQAYKAMRSFLDKQEERV